MKIRIEPGKAKGTVKAPLSKSYLHRYIIGCALSGGAVNGVLSGQDIMATLECVSALRISYEVCGGVVRFYPKFEGGKIKTPNPPKVFQCAQSGSTMRFFMPIALALAGFGVFKGTGRLLERCADLGFLTEKGISVQKDVDSITLSGKLCSGIYTVPGNISSQYASGLLFALPLLEGESRILINPPLRSRSYIDLTLDVLKTFGIRVCEDDGFVIPGGQHYQKREVSSEGDWSNAAALYVYNLAGGSVTVEGLDEDSLQGDKVCLKLFERLFEAAPVIDLSDCPDLAPLLFAAAPTVNGAMFTGTKVLRYKECDRIYAMCSELKKFSVETKIFDDSVIIPKASIKKPSETLCSHDDHRIVMALSFLASMTGGEIEGAQAVSKSYPGFFDTLSELGLVSHLIHN